MPQPGFGFQQQQHQLPGGRRRSGGIQQSQQQNLMMQQQMHPRGQMFRYPQGRGGSGDLPPYDMPMPIGALASNLASASPEQQRTMLGETLYPLVEQPK